MARYSDRPQSPQYPVEVTYVDTDDVTRTMRLTRDEAMGFAAQMSGADDPKLGRMADDIERQIAQMHPRNEED
jgi:hypothetical protein